MDTETAPNLPQNHGMRWVDLTYPVDGGNAMGRQRQPKGVKQEDRSHDEKWADQFELGAIKETMIFLHESLMRDVEEPLTSGEKVGLAHILAMIGDGVDRILSRQTLP